MCFFILQPYPPPHTHNLHPQHFTSSTLSTCLQVFLHVRHLVQQAATPDMFSINIKSGEGVFLSSFSFIFYRCYISCNSVSLILRLHRRIIIFHILIKCICSVHRFILRYHRHYYRLLGTFDSALQSVIELKHIVEFCFFMQRINLYYSSVNSFLHRLQNTLFCHPRLFE